jgi:hypothetical protein
MENNAMKNILKVTAIACLMTTASNAMAGPSANVSVKGTVTQGACQPTISNELIDFGDISSIEVAEGPLQLPETTFQLSISCASDTLVSIGTIDNRNASTVSTNPDIFHIDNAGVNRDVVGVWRVAGLNYFGLGFAQSSGGFNGQLGSYILTFMYPESVSVGNLKFIQTNDNGTTWIDSTSGVATPGRRQFTLSEISSTEPKAFKNLTVPIKINTALNGPVVYGGLNNIDGNMTFSINNL